MTPLRVFRKTTPLVNAIRLSLLPLAGLSFSAFAAQVNIAPGVLSRSFHNGKRLMVEDFYRVSGNTLCSKNTAHPRPGVTVDRSNLLLLRGG